MPQSSFLVTVQYSNDERHPWRPVMKRFLLLILVCPVLSFLSGCGGGASRDAVNTDRDRQREYAKSLSDDYRFLEGHYQTDISDTSGYYIESDILVVSNSVDGMLIPQPMLVGTYRIGDRDMRSKVPRAVKPASQEPLLNFSFTKGVYDPSTLKFSSKVGSIGGDAINVSCDVEKVPETEKIPAKLLLRCNWIPATAADSFKFVVIRMAPAR
jgi:hypothetical protein